MNTTKLMATVAAAFLVALATPTTTAEDSACMTGYVGDVCCDDVSANSFHSDSVKADCGLLQLGDDGGYLTAPGGGGDTFIPDEVRALIDELTGQGLARDIDFRVLTMDEGTSILYVMQVDVTHTQLSTYSASHTLV